MIGRNYSRDWIEHGNERSREDGVALVLNQFYLYVDPNDSSVAYHLINEGYWESWITTWMTRVIEPEWNCLDIGANFGYYTGVFASLTTGDVLAFEPNPVIASMLNKSVEKNGWTNVRVKPCAVGSEDATLTLALVDNFQGSASLNMTEEDFRAWGENTRTYDVPVKRLDDAVGRRKKWDFIKIDVEGWEPEVFKGAEKVLSYNPLIAVEITPAHPTEFLDMLFNDYAVTSIGVTGDEEVVTRADIPVREWWMLALRKKN
jgi:FkbM family methyltransferase